MAYLDKSLDADMSAAEKLETEVRELVSAAQALTEQWREQENADPSLAPDLTFSLPQRDPDASSKIHEACRLVSQRAAAISHLVQRPSDLVEDLATRINFAACLKWLLELQVLACIPPTGSVSIKDVAQLASVPEADLFSIIRMTITGAGFLREPQLGYVEHTPLSAQLASSKSVRDALMFLTERVTPAAMQMHTRTAQCLSLGRSNRRFHDSTEYVSHDGTSFEQLLDRDSRLSRHWLAYVKHVGDGQWGLDHAVPEVLTRLDWSNLGNACIVETCAPSPVLSSSLAELYPELQLIAQLDGLAHRNSSKERQASISSTSAGSPDLRYDSDINTGRVSIQSRTPGAIQTVRDAAVYVIHIPPAVSRAASPSQPLSAWIRAELQAHLDILRTENRSMMILSAPSMLPQPGSVPVDVETRARLRGLLLRQLLDECEMEIADLIDLVHDVRDESGGLSVTNQLKSRDGLTVALCVKHQIKVSGSK